MDVVCDEVEVLDASIVVGNDCFHLLIDQH